LFFRLHFVHLVHYLNQIKSLLIIQN